MQICKKNGSMISLLKNPIMVLSIGILVIFTRILVSNIRVITVFPGL